MEEKCREEKACDKKKEITIIITFDVRPAITVVWVFFMYRLRSCNRLLRFYGF